MNSIISHDYIVSEVLDVSQTVCHRNVTIICSNGTFKSNSFVLASAFPIFRDILDTPVQVDDPARILIPDLDYSDLETFFNNTDYRLQWKPSVMRQVGKTSGAFGLELPWFAWKLKQRILVWWVIQSDNSLLDNKTYPLSGKVGKTWGGWSLVGVTTEMACI